MSDTPSQSPGPGYPFTVTDVKSMRSSNVDPYKNYLDTIGQVSSPDSGLGGPLPQED